MNWNDKYRPKTFKDFVGNRDTLTAIEGFILSGDIPHLLFYGEVGTGKTALAETVALKLLGDSSNIIEMNASDNRGINDIRKIIINAVRHIPMGTPMRVIILDEADGLTADAQDLLKRPIEKSKNTLFVFTCNNVNAVIKPIKSRCAIFEFKSLAEEDIIEGLKRIAVKENLSLSEQQIREIAKKSNGDMRTAINELQKASALNNRNVEIDKIVQQYMKAQPQPQAQGVKV